MNKSTSKEISNIINIIGAHPIKYVSNPRIIDRNFEINNQVRDGREGYDFIYHKLDSLPPVGNLTLIRDEDVEGKYRAIEDKLYVEFGHELTIYKMRRAYDKLHDLEGQPIHAFKEKMTLFDKFFKTSIKSFLRMVNEMYYKSPGVHSGIPLSKCVEMCKTIYDNTIQVFKGFMKETMADSDFISDFLKSSGIDY